MLSASGKMRRRDFDYQVVIEMGVQPVDIGVKVRVVGQDPIEIFKRKPALFNRLVDHLCDRKFVHLFYPQHPGVFTSNILATGLNYPVVPRGDEEIRFQVAATHTEKDISHVLSVLADYRNLFAN